MTTDPPTVSVGLPVYNGERFLAAAIDSILAQTLSDFELIICDDASTDDTGKIARAGSPDVVFLGRVEQSRLNGLYRDAIALIVPTILRRPLARHPGRSKRAPRSRRQWACPGGSDTWR